MAKQHFAVDELLSEAPRSTIASALSLSSLKTMIDTPDLEFPIDDNDNMEKCQKNSDNNPTENSGEKFHMTF
ncbi:unnamed protein product [Onchocerca flexuosa]|uniref:Ovule protein n=1 Tax=Onchocerca flexuosa TaxID=387005 RepID=A0A183HUT1_9BILA|nr:unnamed protein product [Onchocerca flexuosa]